MSLLSNPCLCNTIPIGLFWDSYWIHDDDDNDDAAAVAANVAAGDAAVVAVVAAAVDDDGGVCDYDGDGDGAAVLC